MFIKQSKALQLDEEISNLILKFFLEMPRRVCSTWSSKWAAQNANGKIRSKNEAMFRVSRRREQQPILVMPQKAISFIFETVFTSFFLYA